MLDKFFAEETVDTVLSEFTDKIKQLEDIITTNQVRSTQKRELIGDLQKEVADHEAEALRAKAVAEQLRKLIA